MVRRVSCKGLSIEEILRIKYTLASALKQRERSCSFKLPVPSYVRKTCFCGCELSFPNSDLTRFTFGLKVTANILSRIFDFSHMRSDALYVPEVSRTYSVPIQASREIACFTRLVMLY
jgi:hypothetical protein